MQKLITVELEIVACEVTHLVEIAPHGALKEAVLILRGKATTSTELKRLPAFAFEAFQDIPRLSVPGFEARDFSQAKASIKDNLPDGIVFLRAGMAVDQKETIGIMLEQLGDRTGSPRRIEIWKIKRVDIKLVEEWPEVRSTWQDAMTREWTII